MGCTWRVGGMKRGREEKSDARLRESTRATTSGSTLVRTPSASSTSALPHRLEMERLPCLATRTPGARHHKRATVEMLKVEVPLPPVPHVSSTGRAVRNRERHGNRPHGAREAGQFIHCFTLHAKRGEEGGREYGRRFSGKQRAHGGFGLASVSDRPSTTVWSSSSGHVRVENPGHVFSMSSSLV